MPAASESRFRRRIAVRVPPPRSAGRAAVAAIRDLPEHALVAVRCVHADGCAEERLAPVAWSRSSDDRLAVWISSTTVDTVPLGTGVGPSVPATLQHAEACDEQTFVARLSPGDRVHARHGRVPAECEVLRVADRNVDVRDADGISCRLPAQRITRLLDPSGRALRVARRP